MFRVCCLACAGRLVVGSLKADTCFVVVSAARSCRLEGYRMGWCRKADVKRMAIPNTCYLAVHKRWVVACSGGAGPRWAQWEVAGKTRTVVSCWAVAVASQVAEDLEAHKEQSPALLARQAHTAGDHIRFVTVQVGSLIAECMRRRHSICVDRRPRKRRGHCKKS